MEVETETDPNFIKEVYDLDLLRDFGFKLR